MRRFCGGPGCLTQWTWLDDSWRRSKLEPGGYSIDGAGLDSAPFPSFASCGYWIDAIAGIWNPSSSPAAG